jgi:hypothetical protein
MMSLKRNIELHPIPVGAELARDGGVSADIHAECAGLIASKLGSYRFQWLRSCR